MISSIFFSICFVIWSLHLRAFFYLNADIPSTTKSMKKSRFNSLNISRKREFTIERKIILNVYLRRGIFILRIDDVDEDTLKWIDNWIKSTMNDEENNNECITACRKKRNHDYLYNKSHHHWCRHTKLIFFRIIDIMLC